MRANSYDALRAQLETKKAELTIRLDRITENLRRGYHPDSKERAKELEDSEVVDALGNEARAELRNISAALQRMDAGKSLLYRMGLKLGHALNSNTMTGSRKNISAHYDLGNDFFSLFLDPSMMYSAAIYPQHDATLEQAATFKNQHICERLQLGAEDHLLEIGTGWGGLAIHAATQYGCRVTTTTISRPARPPTSPPSQPSPA